MYGNIHEAVKGLPIPLLMDNGFNGIHAFRFSNNGLCSVSRLYLHSRVAMVLGTGPAFTPRGLCHRTDTCIGKWHLAALTSW
jgi:hypothetical protein